MNRSNRAVYGAVAAALLLALVAVILVLVRADDDLSTEASSTTTATSPTSGSTATTGGTGASTTGSTATTATPTTEAATEIPVVVYFVRDDHLAAVARSVAGPGTARGAMDALLAGPRDAEAAGGLATAVPAGTRVRSVAIESGTATVDLDATFGSGGGSASMLARVAQVVYTLTQFPTVTSVRFLVDGAPVDALGGEGLVLTEPQTRADWIAALPEVLVETPATGTEVTSPVTLRGLSLTFEATWRVQIVDAGGAVVADQVVTAGGGTEYREFSIAVPYAGATPGPGSIVVSYDSARDGSRVVVDTIPVILG